MSTFQQYIQRRAAEDLVVKAALAYINAEDSTDPSHWLDLMSACRQLEAKTLRNERGSVAC
jgi:hypothetical protein